VTIQETGNIETSHNYDWRENSFEALAEGPLDVLVVGGGIVGSGIVRDAAMRGLRVGLVEQHDFAFGTSSRSARLLHGGLRYLAQGNIRLVRQASLEKLNIHRIAPHVSTPLPFIFPTYRGTPWPKWKLRIGVKLYDLLCNRQNLGPSSSLSAEQVRAMLPGIQTDRLNGGVRYFDGLTNDSRLVVDTLRSAVRHGAIVCSYTRLKEARPDDDMWKCKIQDTITDSFHDIRSRSVVNATGPWSDKLLQSQITIRPTKGVHVVIDSSRLAIPEAVMLTEQKRVVWAIPWGERVYIGCTDSDYDGALENVHTEIEDIEYLLRVTNTYFPDANLTESDLVRTWAGVRPLIADGRGGPSDVSSSHLLKMTNQGWLDAAGGKLTTYRLMAQEAVNILGRFLKRRLPGCRTADELLLDPGEVEDYSSVVPPKVTPDAVRHYCTNEWAVHLDDVMVRRTRWHYYYTDVDVIAQKVSSWMARCLGWTDTRQNEEIKRYSRVLD
jgi:glycerol-3-phosphate dehydrogenase